MSVLDHLDAEHKNLVPYLLLRNISFYENSNSSRRHALYVCMQDRCCRLQVLKLVQSITVHIVGCIARPFITAVLKRFREHGSTFCAMICEEKASNKFGAC